MKYLVLILFLVGFVSAVDVDFDCPDEIFVDEEFECSLNVDDADGEYDVKVDLDGERDSVLEIWDGDVWKSGYYYVKGLVDGDGEYDVKVRVSEADDWDGTLKMRQDGEVEYFDIEVEVGEGKEVKQDDQDKQDFVAVSEKKIKKDNGVIMLSSVEDDVEEEVVYSSRNSVALDYAVYVFCGVLILIIGVLLWERF